MQVILQAEHLRDLLLCDLESCGNESSVEVTVDSDALYLSADGASGKLTVEVPRESPIVAHFQCTKDQPVKARLVDRLADLTADDPARASSCHGCFFVQVPPAVVPVGHEACGHLGKGVSPDGRARRPLLTVHDQGGRPEELPGVSLRPGRVVMVVDRVYGLQLGQNVPTEPVLRTHVVDAASLSCLPNT